MATVSSHILNSVVGNHAAGIRVELYRLHGSSDKEQIFDVIANEEGRIAEQVEIDSMDADVQYELVFHSADYFTNQSTPQGKQNMAVVVVRLRMPDANAKYHIPLVLSPHSYTIWWSGV